MTTSASWAASTRRSSTPPEEKYPYLWTARREGITPDDLLDVDEWADLYRILPPEESAMPGRWRTDRVPFAREIMKQLSPSSLAETVILMKGGQIAGTNMGLNLVGASIHLFPCPILLVQGIERMAKRSTLSRLDPMIASTPVLKRRVSVPRSRDGGNSIFRKKFPGGELIAVSASSAASLRMMPARILLLDEVDSYPLDVDGEGDPVDLAVKRTVTFRSRRKIFELSTPTIAGRSRIERAYLLSDQRKYFLPCLGCGHWDFLSWDKITWPKDRIEEASYECQECHRLHPEHEKYLLLEKGEWRATAPGDGGRTVGYHLPGLYSPFETWADQAVEFEKVRHDPPRFKTWVNTTLAETWKQKGEAPEFEHLYARRERYRIGTVPQGGMILTAGVDVQADRLEVEIVAWGRNQENWSVDYRVLLGITAQPDDPVWDQLSGVLNESFPHQSGREVRIMRLAIDDGYNSQIVRLWARRHAPSRVLVCRGDDGARVDVSKGTYVDIDHRGRTITRGIRLHRIGTGMLKEELYGWLKLPLPEDGQLYGYGYCHFPQYDLEHFKQLTAETLTPREYRGYTIYEWVKTRPRNEALDCRLYARAAACSLGLQRWGEKRWIALAEQFGPAGPEQLEGEPEVAVSVEVESGGGAEGKGEGEDDTAAGEQVVTPPSKPPPAPPQTARPPVKRRRVVSSNYMRR